VSNGAIAGLIVFGLPVAAWLLSRVYERVWDWIDETSTKPDYRRIAFLEEQMDREAGVELDG